MSGDNYPRRKANIRKRSVIRLFFVCPPYQSLAFLIFIPLTREKVPTQKERKQIS